MHDPRQGSIGDYFETILDLIDYEIWCNLRLVDFLSGMTAMECHRDFGFGLRTPHRTVSHIADVMHGWSGAVGPDIRKPSWPDYDPEEPLESIRRRMARTGEFWIEAARDSHQRGLLSEGRRLNHVFHLVTHGTHHRGQLLGMITVMGHSQPFEGGDYGGWSARNPER